MGTGQQDILADLHIHTTFSDGQMTLPETIDFYGKRGFGAIAITDHLCENTSFLGKAARYLDRTLTPATFPLYREILLSEAERAKDQYGMIVIPGYELTKNSLSNHRSAHILGLGVDQFMKADGDAVELIETIHDMGGLAVAAHPVNTRVKEKQTYHLWDRREELRHHFDAWEVASGPHLFDEVAYSDLPMLASTDLHRPEQITAWKTIIRAEKHPEALLEAIKKQHVTFYFYEDKEVL